MEVTQDVKLPPQPRVWVPLGPWTAALPAHRRRPLLLRLSEILDVDGVSTEHPEMLLFDFDAEGLIDRVDIYLKRAS